MTAKSDSEVSEVSVDLNDAPDESRREVPKSSKGWWLLVVALLSALVGCGSWIVLLPRDRDARGKETLYGLTPILSVYGLHQPLGVASGPQGEIVVANTGIQNVLMFDSSGRFMTRLGGDLPENRVFAVNGVLSVGGTVYVCDWTLRRVWIFSEDGSVRGFFPKDPMDEAFGEGGLTPYDLVKFGDDILVSSRGGIFRFDAWTGESKGRFDRVAEGQSEIAFANGLTADFESGRVYATDPLNRRVIAFDREGNRLWEVGRPDEAGKIVSFFALPRGVVLTEGGVLVSDTFRHRLVLLSEEGELLGTYGDRGVVDGKLNFPEGLDVAPDGLVYVADRENNRVQVVRLETPVPVDAETQALWESSYMLYPGGE